MVVLDKNDNFPLFQNVHNRVNVSENSRIGQVFYRVLAADCDDGNYGEINYKLKNHQDLFNLDAKVSIFFTNMIFSVIKYYTIN